MCMPFYFYVKRVFMLFPFLLILIGLLAAETYQWLAVLNPFAAGFFMLILVLSTVVYSADQLRTMRRNAANTGNGILDNCQDLEKLLPEGAALYLHCYGYRFFWQIQNYRLFSADDQVMNNQMIAEWAIREKGRYVLLSQRGGPLSADIYQRLKPIKSYKTAASESDLEEDFKLFEIV